MTSLWFLVPANGRLQLSTVCLSLLRDTCDRLTDEGIRASAVVVADDDNLQVAARLGFGTVRRDNTPLGRKWNDAYELAGRAGVDYVVPFGSDDWIDPQLILTAPLPEVGQVTSFQRSAIVSEDGQRIARLRINHPLVGGDGIRVIPTRALEPLNYRPAAEDAPRAIDTSVMRALSRDGRPEFLYHHLHDFQIVDWKSPDEQLNGYDACQAHRHGDELDDPYTVLAEHYPAWALTWMRSLHEFVDVTPFGSPARQVVAA